MLGISQGRELSLLINDQSFLATGGRGTSTVVVCQQFQHSLVVSGSREKVSLGRLAIELLEQANVLFRFRPFGDDFQTKIVGKHNDDPHDLAAFGVAVHVRNEGAVDLQGVYWNPAQAAE